MPRLPRLRAQELIKVLHKAGFATIWTRGSHHFLRHPDGRCTIIPIHSGEIIGPGLLNKILKDIEFDVRDLTALLK
jgi:predicted RNA binding protein YcfA (HicA-like mRNA interferase family)